MTSIDMETLFTDTKGANYYFNNLAALSGNNDSALIGAYSQSNSGFTKNGAAYVFIKSPIPPTPTSIAAPPHPDTIGVYKDGFFYLRNSNTTGMADITVAFGGDLFDLPVAGDWNGDGLDAIGVYRRNSSFFLLSDSNIAPTVNYTVLFGNPGDMPFTGHWTIDMMGSGIGVYRSSNGILYQRKSLLSGTHTSSPYSASRAVISRWPAIGMGTGMIALAFIAP